MTTICNKCGAEDTKVYGNEGDMYYCSELCGSDDFKEIDNALTEWQAVSNQFTHEQQVLYHWLQDVMRQGDAADHMEEIDRRIAEAGLTDKMLREYSAELAEAAVKCF